MAPRSQPPVEKLTTPSDAWLVCAACGPLSESLAQQAGVCLSGDVEILCDRRRCEVMHPVPLPTLRRWVAGNKAVLEAIESIEYLRSRGGDKKRPPTHEEIAGSARAALLLGRRKAFAQHYRAYVQEKSFVWHPDPQHTLFWDRVLGPGWAGADMLPAGEAQDELHLLSASAFAFFAPPAGAIRGAGLCGAPAGQEWLEVAAALRVGERGALAQAVSSGSRAALAAEAMLMGMFDGAQGAFERLFGRTEESRYRLVQQHGLPLLVYALVNGVFAGGSVRFMRAWFASARYAVQNVFSASMEKQQGEMMRFLDHLEQVDGLVNRNSSMVKPPSFNGALSQLPFAMTYASLPASVRCLLKPDALASALDTLAGNGLRLLARYGASALRSAPELSPKWRARLDSMVAAECGVRPVLASPAPERAFAALAESVNKYARRGYAPLQVPGAHTPVLVASRMAEGVRIELDSWEWEGDSDIPEALRCMQKYACKGQLLLEGATPAEFTRLFVALQPQVDVVGSLALPGESVLPAQPEPVLLLAHLRGGSCVASLRLRLLPGATPLMVPGCGLTEPVLEGADGEPLAVHRNTKAEWQRVEETVQQLKKAGLGEEAEQLLRGSLALPGFGALAQLLRLCRELGLEACWDKDHALTLHQPQGGLSIRPGQGAGDWLELGGGLPVDEERVLELSCLLEVFGKREGDALPLGGGQYVMLNPALERQLALLELVWQEKRGRGGVSAAALPLLEALDGGCAPWTPPSVPAGLCATLRPYQREGYNWLAERAEKGMGALLADDMGLGKTVQVLALLLHEAEQGDAPSLVVAPVSLLGNWAEEAARFAPSLRVVSFDPRKAEALDGLGCGTLVLASYGQIASRQKDFAAQSWGIVVLDEAQAIKNPEAQRARAVCTLRARARFCLTGTPVENSLLDLWSQLRFLTPGLLGARAAFQRRFRKSGPDELALLRQVLAPLVLRRTKSEVLSQLPPLTETIEWVDFSREERALYESLRRAAVAKLGKGGEVGAAGVSMLAELTRLRRACCHGKLAFAEFTGKSSKLSAMMDRVEELRAAGRRVLIFSQFTDVLDLAQEVLLAGGISLLRLDGSTPVAQRSKLVSAFQQGRADAFLISLKAGGAGLNLTAADYVMLLDPWWNPAVEAQAAGRSHRMGQRQPVTLCRFMVRETVEERILRMHKEKQELAESILSGGGEGLSLAHLRALLS